MVSKQEQKGGGKKHAEVEMENVNEWMMVTISQND